MEWYGLTVGEAIKKLRLAEAAVGPPPPLKHQYRAELIDKLRALREEQGSVRYAKHLSDVHALRPSGVIAVEG